MRADALGRADRFGKVDRLASRFRTLTPMPSRRSGQIRLMPAQRHQLQVSMLLGELVLDRADADWLRHALASLPPIRHLVEVRLMATHALLSAEDAEWLLGAIAHFERELDFEDRRSEDRLHPAQPIRVEV